MRQVTVTEKYRAVNEGKMAKNEFVRQMRLAHPSMISQYSGYDDTVQILKNRGYISEISGIDSYDSRRDLNISLESINRGVRYELSGKGIDPTEALAHRDEELLSKIEATVVKNLKKDPLHYINLLAKESSHVDKNDKMKETKRGAADKDTFNDLKKATLKEGYTEEQIEAAIQRIKERKGGDTIVDEHEFNFFQTLFTPKYSEEEIEAFLKSNDYQEELKYSDLEEKDFADWDAALDLFVHNADRRGGRYDLDSVDEVEKSEEEKEIQGFKDKALVDAGVSLTGTGASTHEIVFDHRGTTQTIAFRDSEEAAEQAKAKLEDTGYFGDKNLRVVPAGMEEKKDIVKEAGKTALIQTMNNAISAIKGKFGNMPGIAGIIRDFLKTYIDDLANGADPLDEFENYVNANYDSLSETEVSEEYKAAYDSLIEAIKELNTDGDEISAAQDAMEFIGQHYSIDFEFGAGPSRMEEKKGKDHDGDGDIDGDDYMAAKDKAIKGAMGKDEQIKEAVKSIIKKVLTENTLNEAATGNLSKFSDDYADFAGMTQIINQLENLVTEVEGFYAKTGDKLQKIFDSIGNVTNEEGLKVGGFIAPAIESAFKRDIQPVVKRGFMNAVQIPTIKQISSADIDAHNSGERPLGEEEMEEKQTMFTPVMESKKNK